MSYEKYYPGGWQSGESGGTPITPEALNHIENGIKQTYSDFAPAGYGLGDICTAIDSWNNATKGGLYKSNVGAADDKMWWGCTIPYNDTNAVQIAFRRENGQLVKCVRNSDDGTWSPWEWENPPMIPGVEYRTTERRNGKPIYVKAVNIGAVVNGANTKYTEARYNGAVKVFASADGYLAPYYLNGALAFAVNAEPADGGVHVSLYSNGNFDGIATTVCLWYTKD